MSSCSDSDSDVESEPEIFHDENLVIISSSEKINMMQWKDYVHDNWDRLIKENSRLLVLASMLEFTVERTEGLAGMRTG